jgi:hypothetical protein
MGHLAVPRLEDNYPGGTDAASPLDDSISGYIIIGRDGNASEGTHERE